MFTLGRASLHRFTPTISIIHYPQTLPSPASPSLRFHITSIHLSGIFRISDYISYTDPFFFRCISIIFFPQEMMWCTLNNYGCTSHTLILFAMKKLGCDMILWLETLRTLPRIQIACISHCESVSIGLGMLI